MSKNKTCTNCKEIKLITEFYFRNKQKTRRKPWCRDCISKYNRKWNQKNKEKRNEQIKKWQKGKGRFNHALITSRANAKRHGYMPCNATIEEIKVAFTEKCNICGKLETEQSTLLCLDHCHTTGKFRGWLCLLCNVKLGGFWDSEKILVSALQHIRGGK